MMPLRRANVGDPSAVLWLADAGDSGFDLLLLIPIIVGALLVLALLVWLVMRYRRRQCAKSQEQLQCSTPSIRSQQQGVESRGPEPSRPLTSPSAVEVSFSRLQDDDANGANASFGLSGSGRTVRSGSVKSMGSALGPPRASDDYTLAPPQRDELFQILNHDPALAARRLAVDKIAFERVLGQSTTRQLWLCQFEGEEIVVKRLVVAPPTHDKRANDASTTSDDVFPALLSFAHEIRLAAKLEHPNVVRFLGVAWGASLRSLCFVSEFVVRGDLASFLRQTRPRRLETHAQTHTQTQTSWERDLLPLALDIARALEYLHSQRPQPVVYRVLQARKVALTDRLEPKLMDFAPAAGGAPLVDQEAMATGAGAAYWTAPELLTGDTAHSRASDLYAFGVLLSELDSAGGRPYEGATELHSGASLRAFQVLNLVVSGALRPHLTAQCPVQVRQMAAACVHTDPRQRPSARDVVRRLEESAREAMESASGSDNYKA